MLSLTNVSSQPCNVPVIISNTLVDRYFADVTALFLRLAHLSQVVLVKVPYLKVGKVDTS